MAYIFNRVALAILAGCAMALLGPGLPPACRELSPPAAANVAPPSPRPPAERPSAAPPTSPPHATPQALLNTSIKAPSTERVRPGQAGGGADQLSALAEEMAARVAGFRRLYKGNVTDVSRRGFRVNIGAAEGLKPGLEARVSRIVDGKEVAVASAEVVRVDDGSSFLRRTDRIRWHSVKKGDVVRVTGGGLCVLVGPITGDLPEAILDAFRSGLLRSLGEYGSVTALDGPRSAPGDARPWQPEPGLSESAVDRGCSHALTGWTVTKNDSLHIILGLVDAVKARTVELFTGSVRMDAALAAAASAGAEGAPPPAPGGRGPGAGSYYARLMPVRVGMPEEIVAVQVLPDREGVFLVGKGWVAIYEIRTGGRFSWKEVARLSIEGPPERVPCRDPIGTISLLDSEGDGVDEIALWSSVLSGPAAFSVSAGGHDGGVELERAETFWLPWADPLGGARFIRGENEMSAPSCLGESRFYSWKTADLNGDGIREIATTEPGGFLTVRDSSLVILDRVAGIGSALAVHDMNGDGIPEVITTSSSSPDSGDVITFYNWEGAGLTETFEVDRTVGGIVSVSAGYLDGDDWPDLVAAMRVGPRGRHSVLFVFVTLL